MNKQNVGCFFRKLGLDGILFLERSTSMRKVYLTIVVVLLLAFVSALAVAKPGAGEGKRGNKGMVHGMMQKSSPDGGAGHRIGILLRLKEKLGLDEEQVEKLTAIKEECKVQSKANAEAVRAAREALRKTIETGASEADIRMAATSIGKALGDQAVFASKTKAKVDGILTADQKAKLEELKLEWTKGRREQSGEGQRGGGEGTKGYGLAGKGAGDPESAFARIDSDGDGAISAEEFKTHMEQMKERLGDKGPRDGRRPRGGRGPKTDED